MDLRFEFTASRSAGTREQQRGAWHADYLGDDNAREKAVAFAVLADGVEGHAGGQVASNLVVTTFNRTVERTIGSASFPRVLRDSMDAANSALGDAIAETPQLKGMACTVAGALLVGGRLHWASVGDPTLLLLRGGRLQRLNADHSYGAFLEQARAEGVDATPEEGLTPDMLMSAVTGEPIPDIDCPTQGFDLEHGDRVILAGPALGDLEPTLLLRSAKAGQSPKEALSALSGALDSARGTQAEGTTLIVFDVVDHDPPPVVVPSPAATAATAAPAAAAPAKGSLAMSILTALATCLLFVAAAAGTWFGLAELEAWREMSRAAARQAPVAAPPPVPATPPDSSVAVAPPPPAVSSPPSGGGLTIGAPPPAPGGSASAPARPEAPLPAGGFRDPLADGGEGPLMMPIPAGSFEMGSRSPAMHPAAAPRHTVSVPAFAMSAHEVSIAQYARFAKATGRAAPAAPAGDPETTPVSGIAWNDAYAYTVWLSKQTGQRYRLPSEAQWEYAARGGTTTAFWWGNAAGKERAHCFDCDTGLDTRRASRAGRFEPNPYGLYDTAGNVAEWVHDCWHPNYNGAPGDGRVFEGGDCGARVVRGGSFGSPSKALHSSARESVPAERALNSIGFRVARAL